MYERFMKQWNGKYRLLTGLVLFLIGLILQFLSGKVLDMYAFYTMSAAMLCVVNVIIRKLAKTDVDEEGNEMESAPHPKQKLWVDLGCELHPFDILRRKEN